MNGTRCSACGRDLAAQRVEHQPRPVGRVLAPSPLDFPELKAAFEAWGQRDFTKMISECLTAAGVRASRPEQLAHALGWIFGARASVVFVLLDRTQELSIEAPLVLVPAQQQTPLFRALLELNARALGSARFCLRHDRVVLKYADPVENVSPPKFMSVLREVAGASDHFSQLLGHRFQAPLLGPEIRKPNADPWKLLGAPTRLELGGAAHEAESQPDGPVKMEVAEQIEQLSDRTFSSFTDVGEEEELELARDPYEGRHDHAALLIARLRQAFGLLDRVPTNDGGLYGLLLLRAVVWSARTLTKPEGQGEVAYAGVLLGEWMQRLPEPGFKPGGKTPGLASVHLPLITLARREEPIDERWTGKVYPIERLKNADAARTHVRKLMALMTSGPKEDLFRLMLLEGAICELLLRAPLQPEVEKRVVQTLVAPAPPSAVRVHELQNLLTRSWP